MIRFGTSGFRGIINENFTIENISKIAYALAEITKKDKTKNPKIAVGFDNRSMGKEVANVVAEVLASNDIDVILFTKSIPSPLLTFMTKTYNFGFMITASHNPYNYNGVKIFLNPGKEADDEFAKRIEDIANNIDYETIKNTLNSNSALKTDLSTKVTLLAKTTMSIKSALPTQAGSIRKTSNISTYCKNIINLIDANTIKKRNLKVLFNAMHGSSVDCLVKIANDLGLKNYKIMNANPDIYFGGKIPAPYKHNLIDQAKLVKKQRFDIGLALDGDGDRITAIDRDGTIYDCNYLLPIIYNYFLKKGYKGDVIKNTAMSNLTKLLANKNGFCCHDTKVGFKNIGKLLLSTSAFLGGESNGIALKEHILTKDGILIAFLLLDIISSENKTIKQLLTILQKECNFKSDVVEYAYPITNVQKQNLTKLIMEDKKLPVYKRKIKNVSYLDGLKITYEGDYWGVMRFSGNENIIRLFAEMPTLKECNKLISAYEKFLNLKTRQL
jgi:phosphomannomutase